MTARSDAPAIRLRALRALPALLLLAGFLLAAAPLRAASEGEMRSLDQQVQEIKSDVLGIAKDLSLLEERLLYPSGTQVSIFVSMPEGEDFRLDSVQIEVDGEPVAHHIYTFQELEALRKGGVQRIYTGNVVTGSHRLDVTVAGQSAGGRDFTGSRSFSFSKEVEPKLVGLVVTGASGDAAVELGDW